MSRVAAGAALRTLREARDWSLADLAEATGVSVMGLSYLERGARKPHKGTVQKVENGLGLPPGTYARLLGAADPQAEIAQWLTETTPTIPRRETAPVVVDRGTDAAVFEQYAEAQLEALHAVIDRLPPPSDSAYENVVRSVIAQCLKAELLAANSWRVAVGSGADPGDGLLRHVRSLEATRRALLARLGDSLGARLDRACAAAGLPEPVVADLLGLSVEQMWEIRNGAAAVPSQVVPRIRAFVGAAGATE